MVPCDAEILSKSIDGARDRICFVTAGDRAFPFAESEHEHSLELVFLRIPKVSEDSAGDRAIALWFHVLFAVR
jgi:hypothetical protein